MAPSSSTTPSEFWPHWDLNREPSGYSRCIIVTALFLYLSHVFFGVTRAQHLLRVVDSTAMRPFWTRVGIIGPISMAFGSVLWSTKTGADHTSPYDLKLVQVLFRHGARTPLKSIPDVMEVKPL